MEICTKGALTMPKNYAVMKEEEMMYNEGGYWYSQSFSNYTGEKAYQTMMEGRNSSYALILGATVGGTLGSLAAGVVALGLSSNVFGQWGKAK